MRVLITGVSGQDGQYLAEQLIAAGHKVYGMWHRPPAAIPVGEKTIFAFGDLTDGGSLREVLASCRPDQVYNLGAVTAPGGAWGTPQPAGLADVTALGVMRLMTAVRDVVPDARVVHASSSAVYDPQRYGLYGASKVFAHAVVAGYRSGHGMHASNAVLFSHTSSRQGPQFLARRITRDVADIAAGTKDRILLTDLGNRRDWGHAGDYMRALPRIAAQDAPGDYDICTGVTRSVEDLVETAFQVAGLPDWKRHVDVEIGGSREQLPEPYRTPARARRELGWEPTTPFDALVAELVAAARTEGDRHRAERAGRG